MDTQKRANSRERKREKEVKGRLDVCVRVREDREREVWRCC